MRCLLPFLAALLITTSSAFVQPTNLNLASVRQSRKAFGSTPCPYSRKDPSRLSAQAALPMDNTADIFSSASSTVTVSAATVDPTSFLSSVLGGLLGSPAILLIPVLAAVAVDFILLGVGTSTLCWWLANNYLLAGKGSHTHTVEQRVEWLYAFDIHCNSFFPLFLLLYVIHFFLLPFLLGGTLRLGTL